MYVYIYRYVSNKEDCDSWQVTNLLILQNGLDDEKTVSFLLE